MGTYVIFRQVGEHSFELLVGKEMLALHGSQLKIRVEVGLGEEVLDYGAVVRPLLGAETPGSDNAVRRPGVWPSSRLAAPWASPMWTPRPPMRC